MSAASRGSHDSVRGGRPPEEPLEERPHELLGLCLGSASGEGYLAVPNRNPLRQWASAVLAATVVIFNARLGSDLATRRIDGAQAEGDGHGSAPSRETQGGSGAEGEVLGPPRPLDGRPKPTSKNQPWRLDTLHFLRHAGKCLRISKTPERLHGGGRGWDGESQPPGDEGAGRPFSPTIASTLAVDRD